MDQPTPKQTYRCAAADCPGRDHPPSIDGLAHRQCGSFRAPPLPPAATDEQTKQFMYSALNQDDAAGYALAYTALYAPYSVMRKKCQAAVDLRMADDEAAKASEAKQ